MNQKDEVVVVIAGLLTAAHVLRYGLFDIADDVTSDQLSEAAVRVAKKIVSNAEESK